MHPHPRLYGILLAAVAFLGLPAFAQDSGAFNGFLVQAGALQAKSPSADGWASETYSRPFLAFGREHDLGAGLPVVTWWVGYHGGSSKQVSGQETLGPGDVRTSTYSPGAEGTLAFLISNGGRFRFGGGLEVRLGSSEPKLIATGGGDTSGTTVRLRTSTWLQLFSEAELGGGFALFVRGGVSTVKAPRPTQEFGLGLRYRP